MGAKEQTKNRVAIAGQVRDAETKLPIPGVLVEITVTGKPEFNSWLNLYALQYGDNWQKMFKRPDRTLTAIDGCFYFLNLPDGEYELSIYRANAVTFNGTKEDQRLLTNPFNIQINLKKAEDNKYKWQSIDIALLTIKGKITGNNSQKLAKALVQVKDRSASTLSDSNGEYSLSIQNAPKSPTVQVYAPGYDPASQDVKFSEDEVKKGEVEKIFNFSLIPKVMPKAEQAS